VAGRFIKFFVFITLISAMTLFVSSVAWQYANRPIENVVNGYEKFPSQDFYGNYWTVTVGTVRRTGLYTRILLKNGTTYKEQLVFDSELYEVFQNGYITRWSKNMPKGWDIISELPPDAHRWFYTGKLALDEYFEKARNDS
jgi:hypothetical protein